MPSPELQAVWLVRSRAVSAKLRFWLLMAGLDGRPRSLNDRLYLVYVLAFFALWTFALLTLLAGMGANLLALLPVDPAQAAVTLSALGLLAWFLAAAWGAARRSPLVFSDADGQLLCQTPVPRHQVALVWFLTEWPVPALPAWAVAAVLGYAQVEIALGAAIAVDDLPQYLAAGFRALGPVTPLHLALLALAWTLGVHRLQGNRDVRGFRLKLVGAAAVLAAFWLLAGGSSVGRALAVPLTLPLGAAFGIAPWGLGLSVGLLLAAGSLALLATVSRRLSLSRAAQETRGLEALRLAPLTGVGDWAAEEAQRRRLGSGRRPTRLPAGAGAAAVAWKRVVQLSRGLTFTSVATWLLPGVSAVGIVLAPDPGARLWSALIWVFLSVQVCSGPLRNDLSRWWVLRSPPLPQARSLAAIMAVPLVLLLAAALPAIVLGLASGNAAGLLAASVLPGAAGVVAGAAALDILRRARASALMAGVVPGVSSLALLLALVALLPPLGLYLRLAPLGLVPATLAAAVTALAMAGLLGRLATENFRRVA